MTREEAIQIIRETYHTDEEMKALESLIPELESEDERVRKAIDEILKLDKAWQIAGNYGLTVVNIRKYIEKQEQKPAWCEEVVPSREMILAIWELGNAWKERPVPEISQLKFIQDHWKESSYFNKLKSLRPQPKQMPANWTDKDKRILDDISHLLISFKYTEMAREYKRVIEKLIYQPHWKPSEEQIYSLGTVVKGAGENSVGSIGYNLKELYEELKKL